MTTTLQKTLHRLIEQRAYQGAPISPNGLAKATGVPQSTISRILTGQVTDVRLKNLQKIADYFGISVAELRGESAAVAPGQQTGVREHNVTSGVKLLTYVSLLEHDILNAYRSSSEIGRRVILASVKAISAECGAS